MQTEYFCHPVEQNAHLKEVVTASKELQLQRQSLHCPIRENTWLLLQQSPVQLDDDDPNGRCCFEEAVRFEIDRQDSLATQSVLNLFSGTYGEGMMTRSIVAV